MLIGLLIYLCSFMCRCWTCNFDGLHRCGLGAAMEWSSDVFGLAAKFGRCEAYGLGFRCPSLTRGFCQRKRLLGLERKYIHK